MQINITLEQFLILNDLVFKSSIGNYENKEKTLTELQSMLSRTKMFDHFSEEEINKIRLFINKE